MAGFKRENSKQRDQMQLINQTSITEKHLREDLIGRLNKTDISMKGIKEKYLKTKNNIGSIFLKRKMSLKKKKKKVTSLEKRLFNRGNLINIYSKKHGKQKVLNKSKKKRKKKQKSKEAKKTGFNQFIRNQLTNSKKKKNSDLSGESRKNNSQPPTKKPNKKPVKKVKKIVVNRKINSKTSVDQDNLAKIKELIFQNRGAQNKYEEFEQVIGSQFFVFNLRFLQIFDLNFLASYVKDKMETVREGNVTSDLESFSFTCLKLDPNLPLKKLLEFINNQVFILTRTNIDLSQFDRMLSVQPLNALANHWICNKFYPVSPESIDTEITSLHVLKMLKQNRVEDLCLDVIESSFDNDHLVFSAIRCSFILNQISNLPIDFAKVCSRPSPSKVVNFPP